MNKYAHFGHVLHFSGLAYGRHRVQGVKIGGIQSSLLFPYLVPDSFMDLPRLTRRHSCYQSTPVLARTHLVRSFSVEPASWKHRTS